MLKLQLLLRMYDAEIDEDWAYAEAVDYTKLLAYVQSTSYANANYQEIMLTL